MRERPPTGLDALKLLLPQDSAEAYRVILMLCQERDRSTGHRRDRLTARITRFRRLRNFMRRQEEMARAA